MARTISEEEALRRLERASAALGDEPGATVAADTALSAARQTISMLMLGLEEAEGLDLRPPRRPEP